MAVALAQAKPKAQDKLSMMVIDEFRRSSSLMDHMIFDDCVSPVGSGATMTYGRHRVITPSIASFHMVNAEYTAGEIRRQKYIIDTEILGGASKTNRVIADVGGMDDEVTFQVQQEIEFASTLFSETLIIGDSSKSEKSLDGSGMAVTGGSIEYKPSAAIDLSTIVKMIESYQLFLDQLDEFLMGLDDKPSFTSSSLKLITKTRACARKAGMYQVTKNDLDQQVESYGGIPLVGFGVKSGSNDPVISTDTVSGTKGEASLYAARTGSDGFHAVSPFGRPLVKQWLPKFEEANTVKKSEVEMLATAAPKAAKTAGIMRKIKVQ